METSKQLLSEKKTSFTVHAVSFHFGGWLVTWLLPHHHLLHRHYPTTDPNIFQSSYVDQRNLSGFDGEF